MPSNDGVRAVARSFRVLIIGGSYGGLAAALNLSDLARGRVCRFDSNPDAKPPSYKIPLQITVVDERDGYFHLIGSPKSLVCEKFAAESWTRFKDIPALKSPDFSFIQGTVSKVDSASKIAHILDAETKENRTEKYDYLIAASGLRRIFPVAPRSLRREEFLEEARKHVKNVQNASQGIVVVGGGAVGIEMAAELKVLYPEQKITLVHSRNRLLSSEELPDDFAERALAILREENVEVILGKRVIDTTAVDSGKERAWRLILADGQQLMTGLVLNAISQPVATSTYLEPEALNEEGLIKIHPSLQFSGNIPNAEHHLAVGDLAAWSGIKRCGGAMHMGQYAANNIHQHMLAECTGDKPTYMNLTPFPNVIGLALGKKCATYSPAEGTKDGEDLMDVMFGKDMANSICWNYMRLNDPPQA
ncbi:uncharacterized protein N7484_004827 [Penicillium longicatenatum]|uniref:uncharacterized protein n=1 Tax=Penicillium longicatenatum TaxID=1561947 RepID=UPI0025471EA8|nr:uncharacterized protein N7484_004827 [Penicillium longicatenatum]KAJ5651104.1 hypothetical protein N7484_004827 [Penicillium longicatenatum]